ncbi:rho GTPase-activating protein 26 isoform X2 [Hydra vulgaris]|nr:rho GTPase-activating protein 26 isoform X2 [Hydra vulgaris]
MGLKPLEFSECLLDTPYFRDSIYDHEKELDQTNDAIKSLIKECRNLIKALDNVYVAQLSFCTMLRNFKLRYIGEVDSDDDLEYEETFQVFAEIIERVEEERRRMLDHANSQLIDQLEKFRKEQIGSAKEEKKKFDRESERVCSLLDNHLKISPKKKDIVLTEADAQLEHELANFRQMSLGYVSKLHEVNEKKKFEFVEIMLAFMYGQSTFFHTGHDVFNDNKAYLTDLQYKLQTTRYRFDVTRQEAEELKNKTTKKFNMGELNKGSYSRQGYLFVQVKNWGGLGGQWIKHYCRYSKENKIMSMIPYTQTSGKLNSNTDTFVVTSCTRKATELSERRFLFEITGLERPQPIVLQCTSDEDRKQWLEVMEGKEPLYQDSFEFVQNEGVTSINETGVQFFLKCVEAIEARGLDDQGIYRIAGVSSKFTKLLQIGLDQKQLEKLDLLSENSPWEIKTITSAMKQYFRNLSPPMLTYKLHSNFLAAVKGDNEEKKVDALKELLSQLPEKHNTVLNRLLYHLKLVADHANFNLMQASNLGVVLGPTLMRPKEETMAAIMNIKYQSVVVETMIKNYDKLYPNGPSFDVKVTSSPSQVSVSSNITQNPVLGSEPSEGSPSTKYRAPGPPSRPPIRPRNSKNSDQLQEATNTHFYTSLKKNSPSVQPSEQSFNEEPPSIQPSQQRFNEEPPSIMPSQQRFNENPANHHPLRQMSNEDMSTQQRFSGRLKSVSPTKSTGNVRFTDMVTPFTSPFLNTGEEEDVSNSQSKLDSKSDVNANGSEESLKENKRVRLKSIDPLLPPIIPRKKEWKVRTKYTCIAENSAELTFNAGAIITNVRSSTENGWLIGTLNGKTGLIPENYCERID